VNKSKLTRSSNRVIAGVCGGPAEWLGWDIALVPLLYMILTIFSAGFPGIIAFIILWIAMPEETVLWHLDFTYIHFLVSKHP
jgi:phage shock protein C